MLLCGDNRVDDTPSSDLHWPPRPWKESSRRGTGTSVPERLLYWAGVNSWSDSQRLRHASLACLLASRMVNVHHNLRPAIRSARWHRLIPFLHEETKYVKGAQGAVHREGKEIGSAT